MGVTLITGHSGSGHITSADAGRLNAGVIGLDKYVLPTGKKFAYTIISNNEIDIADGDLVDQGRHISLPQNEIETVHIENGVQNKERIDTIAIRYTMDTSSGVESASMILKKGTPVTIGAGTAAPAALTTGNIYAGATVDETALYYVYISGVTVTKVEQCFGVISSLAQLYPVGSIYMSVTATSPASLFGGTWERLKDRFLLGAGDSYPAGSTGGEASHKLSVNEMPSHSHSASTNSSGNHSHKVNSQTTAQQGNSSYGLSPTAGYAGVVLVSSGTPGIETNYNGSHSHSVTVNSTGGGAAHNNMPPYLAVYAWKRVA